MQRLQQQILKIKGLVSLTLMFPFNGILLLTHQEQAIISIDLHALLHLEPWTYIL